MKRIFCWLIFIWVKCENSPTLMVSERQDPFPPGSYRVKAYMINQMIHALLAQGKPKLN